MAEETKRIIEIGVEGLETLRQLQDEVVKARQDVVQLNKDGKSGTMEYQAALVQLKKAQGDYNAEMRIAVKESDAVKGSYNDLVNQLSRLKEQWKATGDEAERANLTGQINGIKAQLNEMDHSIGNWQRNVGNYENSIIGALTNLRGMGGAAGQAASGIMSLTRGAQAFTATGFGAVLAIIAQALNALVKGFKSSEENMNALTVAFAPFKAGGQVVTNMLQGMAKALGSVGDWLNKVLERFGLMTDRMKENQAIAKEEIALRQEQRRVTVENARLEMEVAELRNDAADKANLTTRERIALLESAAAKEKEIADNNLAIAQREFALAQRRAELTGNSIEANDELAQKEAALYEARASYASTMRRITSQLSSETLALRREIGDTTAAAVEMVKMLEISASWMEKMDTGIAARMEETKKAMEEAAALGRDMDALIADADRMAAEASDAALEHYLENVRAEQEAHEQRIRNYYDMADAVGDILSSIAGAYRSDIELRVQRGEISEQEARSEFETVKGLQLANTWINTLAGVTAALTAPTLQSAGPLGWAVAGAQAAALLASGIAQTAKIRATTLGKGGGGTASGGDVPKGVAYAPAVIEQVPVTRQVTSAEDEEQLRAARGPARVQLVWTDLQAMNDTDEAQKAEVSFGG